MRALIVTTILGCFGLDEKASIISFEPFPKNPAKIAEKIREAETKILEEEKQVISQLKKAGFREFIFNIRKPGVVAQPGSSAEQFVKGNLRALAIERGFVRDEAELNKLLTEVSIYLTKEKIREVFERDKLVIQANHAIEELDRAINILVERLREFYAFHFPELDKAISSHERFARAVEQFGSREKMGEPELKELAEGSIGAEFSEEDIKIAQAMAAQITALFRLRASISDYMERNLSALAPNFSEIATPTIGAKLLARAGSLERLAKMASSTIQLLGAERALFKYLRGRGKGPRFGILALHPLVQGAPEQLKGRIARVLASKLSIAAKIDRYSKEYRAKELKKDLEERVKEILSSK